MILKHKQHTSSRKADGTAATVAAGLLALALAAASGCTASDTANETAANRAASNKPSVTVTAQRGTQRQQPPPQPMSDTLSAEIMNAEIPALDGKPFRLSDFKDKVVVLDLWATWCSPCRDEVPHLVELTKEYGQKNVEVIGLTTERPERDEAKVREFAKEFKINYRIGWADSPLALGLMRGRTSIPQTFVIAPGGRVVAHYRGFSSQLPTRLRADIDKAKDKAGD